MRFLNEKSLRHFIRQVISEDVYSSGMFSPDRLQKSIDSYVSGDLAARGINPDQAREVALDDLKVAFGEMGYDMYAGLQDAIFDADRQSLENQVREILSTDFVGPRGPLRNMGIQSLDDVLLPGDVDELVGLIVGDLLDGDGMVTLQ